MNPAERTQLLLRDLGGVLPRSVNALAASPGWSVASPRGVRQLGEVMLDELVLTSMSLLGGNMPGSSLPLSSYGAAAEELSGLGVIAAHGEPPPLRPKGIRRHRIGRLAFEQLCFEHDPSLPRSLQAENLGGPATAGAYLFRRDDERRPWLVWVHGAGQGQPIDLLVSRAQRLHHSLGFNVALPVQPGHGFRRSVWPPYPDMEPLANVAGLMRSISEVRAVVRWLEPQSTSIVVSGVSLGSPVAAFVSALEQAVDAVAAYTPILGLNSMIAQHLDRWGPAGAHVSSLLVSDEVAALTSVVDPRNVEPAPPPDRRLIVGALHDRMAKREPALALQERWRGQLHWYDGGHAGHIFSRRVQAVTERFLRGVAS
jgi:pimeloyl-ACP methyl ester carboxylesterase